MMKWKKFIFTMLMMGLSSAVGESAVRANTLQIRPLLEPVNLTDVSNSFLVENQTLPVGSPYMVVRWQDDASHPGNAVSNPVTYDAGAYTGFTPPSPRENWQRGEYDIASSGTPVFQLYGTNGGMLMNSWATTFQQITGGGQNTVYGYEFPNPVSPWGRSTSRLWIQGDIQLPWIGTWNTDNDSNAPVGQLSYITYLRDIATQKTICIVVNAFDNRPTIPAEQIMHDTYTYFASTRFGGTRYATPNPYSGTWRSSAWSGFTFYRAEITRQNMQNIIQDMNNQGAGLSTDPANFVLTSVGILQETFRENGDHISLGSSFRNFGAYEAYE